MFFYCMYMWEKKTGEKVEKHFFGDTTRTDDDKFIIESCLQKKNSTPCTI